MIASDSVNLKSVQRFLQLLQSSRATKPVGRKAEERTQKDADKTGKQVKHFSSLLFLFVLLQIALG